MTDFQTQIEQFEQHHTSTLEYAFWLELDRKSERTPAQQETFSALGAVLARREDRTIHPDW